MHPRTMLRRCWLPPRRCGACGRRRSSGRRRRSVHCSRSWSCFRSADHIVPAHIDHRARRNYVRLVSFFIGFAGLILLLLGTIWFLIEAFSEDFLWGLGCLFLPILQWVFL